MNKKKSVVTATSLTKERKYGTNRDIDATVENVVMNKIR